MSIAPRTLRANFSWTLVANIIYAACQWGVISAIAKIGDAEMVGEFALTLAIAAPIQAFFQMQLRGVQATDARRQFDDGEYVGFRVVTTLIAFIVTISVLLIGDYSPRFSLMLILIGVAKATDSITDVFFGAFQQRERMDVLAKAMIAKGALSLVLALMGLWWTQSIVVATVGFTLGSIFPLVLYILPLSRSLVDRHLNPVRWWQWSLGRARALLRISLPLGIVMLLVSLNDSIPRYVIQIQLGTRELGIFAALSYLLVAGSTVVNAMGQAVSPRLASQFATGQIRPLTRLIWTLVLISIGIGLAGFAVSMLIGDWILRILYTSIYGEYVNVLAILALGAGLMFAASICGYGLTAARKFDVQVSIFVIVIFVNIVSSLILIPLYGLEGAAASVGVTQGANLALCWFVLAATIRNERAKHGSH